MVNPAPTSGPQVTSIFSKDEADLLYVEVMVPKEGDRPHTYWSSCNFYFGKRGGYAGIQHQEDKVIDGVRFKYNNICSIWDLEDKESHLPTEVGLCYRREGTHWSHFGNEGTGLHTSHPMPWSTSQWYATVIRRWYIPGESVTRAAMFMYSYSEKKWTLYITVTIPGINISLTGKQCNAFLERFRGDAAGYHGIYGQHFRMDRNGAWEKPLRYVASAGGDDPTCWKAELYQGVNIKLSAGGCFDNAKNEHTFHPNQFDDKPKPAMETPSVTKVVASYSKEDNTIHVDWQIAEDKPPQLEYRIVVYPDVTFERVPVAQDSGQVPEARRASFPPESPLQPGTYWVNVEFTDIFNQKSNSGYNSFSVL